MRLQSGSPGLAVGDADNRYLRLTGGTLAGNLNVGSGRIVATAPAGTIPQSGDPSAGQTLEHTWNGAGNTWTAFQVNVTDTASAAASKLLDLKVGGASIVSISKAGKYEGQTIELGRDGGFASIKGRDRSAGTMVNLISSGYSTTDLGSSAAVLQVISPCVDLFETTAPSAPGANSARLYVEDNGSGKTRLMVLFPSGAAQQVAIEP